MLHSVGIKRKEKEVSIRVYMTWEDNKRKPFATYNHKVAKSEFEKGLKEGKREST